MAAQTTLQLAVLKGVSPGKAVTAILVVSVAALGMLFGVIYGHGRASTEPVWLTWLPAWNALLNGTSAVFLVLAYRAVKARRLADHTRYVLTAMGASTLFLVSYIVYHSVHGDTRFLGQGAIRPVYFAVLISHVSLSAVALPLVFSSFFFALSGRFAVHRRISRYTFPIWLYVSVTGVLVFALLRTYG